MDLKTEALFLFSESRAFPLWSVQDFKGSCGTTSGPPPGGEVLGGWQESASRKDDANAIKHCPDRNAGFGKEHRRGYSGEADGA